METKTLGASNADAVCALQTEQKKQSCWKGRKIMEMGASALYAGIAATAFNCFGNLGGITFLTASAFGCLLISRCRGKAALQEPAQASYMEGLLICIQKEAFSIQMVSSIRNEDSASYTLVLDMGKKVSIETPIKNFDLAQQLVFAVKKCPDGEEVVLKKGLSIPLAWFGSLSLEARFFIHKDGFVEMQAGGIKKTVDMKSFISGLMHYVKLYYNS